MGFGLGGNDGGGMCRHIPAKGRSAAKELPVALPCDADTTDAQSVTMVVGVEQAATGPPGPALGGLAGAGGRRRLRM